MPDARERLERKNSAFSGFIGPDGRTIGDPLIDDEGIVYADIDLGQCIQPKQMHDIIGHYNRFDIFDLRVDRTPRSPIALHDDPGANTDPDTKLGIPSEADGSGPSAQ